MSSRVSRLGAEQVGQRVVVRRRLPGGRVGDVLGELLGWDDGGDGLAHVLTRHGEVRVPIRDVVAGKAVPPAPVRRGAPHRSISWQRLQDIAADGWRPLELGWLGEPGQGWRLRAAQGFTGRANSVLVLGDPGRPVQVAVAEAESWYRSRGLPPRFAVPWPMDADRLGDGAGDVGEDRVLRSRGYLLDTPTLVMSAALDEVTAPDSLQVTVDAEPDEAWLALYRYRGQALPPVARQLLLSAPAQAFVSVRDGACTVAVGRAASSRGWTGVSAMDVAPSHRRQGLGRIVLGAIAQWGLARGDRSAYLQVAQANAPARALYASAGFAVHHGYHYRLAPAQAHPQMTRSSGT